MIWLIVTTSIKNKSGVVDENHRRVRYIECILTVMQMTANTSIRVIVVENNGSQPTYLDDLGSTIVYTNNNEKSFPHKGVNELLDIQHVIDEYAIPDDDVVIKLTGRYKLLSPAFIQMVLENCEAYDAFVKFFNVCAKEYMHDDCVLGLFASRCKYLRGFTYPCERSPECEFATHIRGCVDPKRLMEVQHLDLECCFADDLRMLVV